MILTVVGARPQFIKAAALSRVLRERLDEKLVHTGQHHDRNMSDVFFDELDIPRPDVNLGIAGGTHAQMTARMLIALEEVLDREKPDLLLVYGDTNSTLAAALAAAKLGVPVAHVEAGNRVGTLRNPEEVNRILTDHVSALKFACVPSAMDELAKENLLSGAHLVGDPMYDAFLYYRGKAEGSPIRDLLDFDGDPIPLPPRFYYMTCHRQENTGDPETLHQILSAMDSLDAPAVYPVHPRNRADVEALRARHAYRGVLFSQPVGYLTSIALVSRAEKVVTDSGGVQREAFFAGKQCVTILDFVCWPETMTDNRNRLAAPDRDAILAALGREMRVDPAYRPFGDGHACEKITDVLAGLMPGKGGNP
ncbi:MAG TPA: UDP-N-acetylglucosamine 2-epimerase (non-hydrolyzing) [Candidatus Limnocylindria bacterium]|nr:UDP-N-acetylglucosamine 2-epimerase (non-hydrolyzing) [Candidatus Limnocylindria bacterium]